MIPGVARFRNLGPPGKPLSPNQEPSGEPPLPLRDPSGSARRLKQRRYSAVLLSAYIPARRNFRRPSTSGKWRAPRWRSATNRRRGTWRLYREVSNSVAVGALAWRRLETGARCSRDWGAPSALGGQWAVLANLTAYQGDVVPATARGQERPRLTGWFCDWAEFLEPAEFPDSAEFLSSAESSRSARFPESAEPLNSAELPNSSEFLNSAGFLISADSPEPAGFLNSADVPISGYSLNPA